MSPSPAIATNIEERLVGVCGIAAPVRSRSGVAHAAIAVQGPSVRLTPERVRELAPIVMAAATEVEALVIRSERSVDIARARSAG